jgi:deferrochelatase/peroxidase EfeB
MTGQPRPDPSHPATARPAVSRRRFLGGAATLGAGAALGAAAAGGIAATASDAGADGGSDRVPFEGLHQAGIVTPAPAHAIVAAFDTVASDRDQLEETLRALTTAARALTAGDVAAARDPLLPPSDNLILGPEPPPSALTVTVGVGASHFDDRFGLAARRPARLRAMPRFPNDRLEAERTHGDLVVQVCADTPDACVHALRIVMRATRSTLVLRWMLEGFQQPNTLGHGRTSTRNLLGFKDGTANPDPSDGDAMDRIVWIHRDTPGEPAWTSGGTYMVVRIIQNRVEFWDRTALATQEGIIGRHKASGAPLDGTDETDTPDFGADPHGDRLRLDGHIRLANPRTRETEANLILRRGFNYSSGFESSGQLDQGLLFVCFQQDLDRGFVTVQNRLNGEALEEYIRPVGGGFFFALPGVRGRGDWLGSTLLS